MPESRLEHQNVKVKQLIDDYRSGRIVIPEFQREYVWKKSRAHTSSTHFIVDFQFRPSSSGKARKTRGHVEKIRDRCVRR
jgi:uncharacterized protein with ParB-like and HNH nuclease domain